MEKTVDAAAAGRQPAPFLRGSSEMADKIRNFDWASNALGPPEAWSTSLQTSVGIMLASIQPMFLVWGPDRIRLYNDAYVPILGNKHPHGLGRPLFDIWSEVQSQVEPMIDRAFHGEALLLENFDVAINRYGQLEETQFSFSYTPVHGVSGQVEGLFGICMETTNRAKRQRAEERGAARLAASEERYRSLFDSMSEGFCILAFVPAQGAEPSDLRYVAVNPAFKRVTHVEYAEGRTLRELFPKEAEAWISIYERVVLTRQAVRFQRRMSKLGRTLELFAYPVLARDREIAVIFTDVTERVEAERARDEGHLRLLQANSRLMELQGDLESRVAARTTELTVLNSALGEAARFNREIADAIPGLMSFWDLEGRCQFANQAYRSWCSPDLGEVVGLTRAKLFGDRMTEDVECCFESATKGVPGSLEVATEDRDGRHAVLRMHYLPARSATGAVRGVYCMGFDITVLKRAERDLLDCNSSLALALNKAESASRAKSAFISNISHEIRTPLNAIMGLAYILRRSGPRQGQQARHLQTIEEEGRQLQKTIDGLLELSDIEAGRLALHEIDFSLDTVFKTAIDAAKQDALAKGLEFTYDAWPRQLLLHGDADRLCQMAARLLSNAVKFTPAGWVRCAVEVEEFRGEEALIRFAVKDSGQGVSEDRQAAIFQKFEQGDNSSTRRFHGPGLGLSVTKHLAAAMGGKVGVESTSGEGSHFWFTVPLRRA